MKIATVGTSWITESFIESARTVRGAEIAAVYSRRRERAEAFAQKNQVGAAFSSLEEMAADSGIDAVYIASPNVCHFEQAALFLNAGKHVICEKPVCLNPEQVKTLYRAADAHRVVFMEAIKGVHAPAVPVLREALKKIGVVRSAVLDFSQYSSRYEAYLRGERPNIFLPEMGAGGFMDLGVYPMFLAYLLFGRTDSIKMQAQFLDTGADAAGAVLLDYKDKVVTVTYSKTADSRLPSQILGDKGVILLGSVSRFGEVKLIRNDGTEETIVSEPDGARVMAYQIEDLLSYAAGGYVHTPYETARRASIDVSEMMELARRDAGGFAF